MVKAIPHFALDMLPAHHHDAVADARDLRQFAEDYQYSDTVLGKPAHDAVDLGLGAEIDATGSARRGSSRGAWLKASATAAPSAGCHSTG
jgi:hypothetical protein